MRSDSLPNFHWKEEKKTSQEINRHRSHSGGTEGILLQVGEINEQSAQVLLVRPIKAVAFYYMVVCTYAVQ